MPVYYPSGNTNQAIVVWGGDGSEAVDVLVTPTGTALMNSTPTTAKQIIGYGNPTTETVDRALTDDDNGGTKYCPVPVVFTIDTGLCVGFGCAVRGLTSFVGTADIDDVRIPGAVNPWCAVVQVDVDSYEIVGGIP
jgi:hypothetical protein